MISVDPFERSLKQALDQYEVPYNSADWSKLESKLDQGKGASWHASAGLYALLLSGALAVGTSLYLLFDQEPEPIHSGLALLAQPEDAQESEVYAEPVVERYVPKPVEAVEVTAEAPAGTSKKDPSTNPTTPNREVRSGKSEVHRPAPKTLATPTGPSSTDIPVRVSTTEGCPGTTIDFGLDNASENGIYLWNFGDGSFSNQARPSHTFSKAGSYDVMLSHSAVGGGSIMNRPVSDPIVIYESPEAAFSQLKRDFPNTVPSVHFENRSIGGKSYLWDFGDGSTSKDVHTDHVYKKKGTYSVVLTVTNGKGCTDRTERIVRIENDYDLFAPKTFSPNSDGVEDTFIPEALKTLGVKFSMSIMDSATGRVVYETNDPARPWNGRIGNKGESCTVGDYVFERAFRRAPVCI